MSLFLNVVTDLVHISKIGLICEYFFKLEKRGHKHRFIMDIFISFLVVAASACMFLLDRKGIELLIYLVIVFVWLNYLYTDKIINILIMELWIMFIVSLFDTLSLILMELFNGLVKTFSNDMNNMCASIISFIFVYVIGRQYGKRYNESVKNIGIKNMLMFTMLAVVDSVVSEGVYIAIIYEFDGKNRGLLYIAFVGVILGMFIQLAAVILLFAQKNLHESRENIAIKYLDEQRKHYEYLEDREIKTKRFRHDLKKHMEMLNVLAKSNKYDEFDEYLEKINMKIDTFGKAITVHDGIVDAVVNQYYSMAVDKGVNMNVSGRFPNDCGINAFDLCTIFSNVLSNAVEAAVESEEKVIDVQFRYTRKSIIVEVKNSYKNVGQFTSGKIKTIKRDMDNHGFGLDNIKETIEKYNGVLDIDITDRNFKVRLLLGYVEKRNYENSNC